MSNNFPSQEVIKNIRAKYPKGTKIRLVQMDNDPQPIEVGTKGVISCIDDGGIIHVDWENGRSLGLVYGEDKFQVIMSWAEATEYMREFNKAHNITTKSGLEVAIVAVMKAEGFSDDGKDYSETERSYVFSNLNKAFLPNMIGYSIFSNCLDKKDLNVRLDWYVDEEGIKDGWKVDYCYLMENLQ